MDEVSPLLTCRPVRDLVYRTQSYDRDGDGRHTGIPLMDWRDTETKKQTFYPYCPRRLKDPTYTSNLLIDDTRLTNFDTDRFSVSNFHNHCLKSSIKSRGTLLPPLKR